MLLARKALTKRRPRYVTIRWYMMRSIFTWMRDVLRHQKRCGGSWGNRSLGRVIVLRSLTSTLRARRSRSIAHWKPTFASTKKMPLHESCTTRRFQNTTPFKVSGTFPPFPVYGLGGKWQRRARHQNVVSRVYSISPAQCELYHLRLLLLYVKGATSFEQLYWVDGERCATYAIACLRRGITNGK